jgi:hypothetical protein
MQRRNSCKIFDPAGTLCRNEGKAWRFSSFEMGIREVPLQNITSSGRPFGYPKRRRVQHFA